MLWGTGYVADQILRLHQFGADPAREAPGRWSPQQPLITAFASRASQVSLHEQHGASVDLQAITGLSKRDGITRKLKNQGIPHVMAPSMGPSEHAFVIAVVKALRLCKVAVLHP